MARTHTQKQSITVKLEQHQIREQAMLSAGISPQQWSMGHGTRVERDRRKEARRGHQKHKGRSFD